MSEQTTKREATLKRHFQAAIHVPLCAAVVLCLGWAPEASAAPCTLSRAVKMTSKAKGKGKRLKTKVGDDVTLVKRGRWWSEVQIDGRTGYIATKNLKRHCRVLTQDTAPQKPTPAEPTPADPAPPAKPAQPAEPAKPQADPAPQVEPVSSTNTPAAPSPAPAVKTRAEVDTAPETVNAQVPAPAAKAAPPPNSSVATVAHETPGALADAHVAAALLDERELAVHAGAAPSRDKPLVAILDVRSADQLDATARALTSLVTAEVSADSQFRAVSRNDLRAILTHQAESELLGCADVDCMVDIANLVKADFLVAGSVEQIESAYVFSLDLIDTKAARIVHRESALWRSAPEGMVDLAGPYVDRLLAGADAKNFDGALEVLTVDGAELFIDGEQVGVAPMNAPLSGLSTGVHVLEVRRSGYLPKTLDVVVARSETTIVRVDLVDEASLQPWYAQWYVWGTGIVVAGAAATTVAIIAANPETTTVVFGEL